MAALRARRFFYLAISSMIEMREAISFMLAVVWLTARPDSSALRATRRARASAWAVLSAFCLIVEASSSTEAESSSMLAACSLAP